MRFDPEGVEQRAPILFAFSERVRFDWFLGSTRSLVPPWALMLVAVGDAQPAVVRGSSNKTKGRLFRRPPLTASPLTMFARMLIVFFLKIYRIIFPELIRGAKARKTSLQIMTKQKGRTRGAAE